MGPLALYARVFVQCARAMLGMPTKRSVQSQRQRTIKKESSRISLARIAIWAFGTLRAYISCAKVKGIEIEYLQVCHSSVYTKLLTTCTGWMEILILLTRLNLYLIYLLLITCRQQYTVIHHRKYLTLKS